MNGIRGGVLASAATAVGLAFADPSICSIGAEGLLEDEAGTGGGGGDEAAAAAAAAAAGGGDEATAAEAAAAAAAAAEPDLSWATGISAEAGEGGKASDMDWLKGTGVKDLPGLVKVARDNQVALRESGRVKVPGEGASEAEVKAFREAIGVPDKPDGYELKLPDGADAYELDGAVLDPLRAVALEHNVPKAAFEAIAAKFMGQMLEGAKAETAANDAALAAKLKEWGPQEAARKAEFRRGVDVLGIDKATIAKIQQGLGVGETMDLIAKIGGLAGEDFFAGGDAPKRFGVPDLASAKAALDAMTADKAVYDKLKAKDPETTDRYNRLVNAVAHYTEQEAKSGRR